MSNSEKRFKIVTSDMSDEEYYYYSDENYTDHSKSNDSLSDLCFSHDANSKDNSDAENSGAESKDNSDAESKKDIDDDDDIPEYRKITQDNMYAFICWANERRDSSISLDHFNMIIQSKMNDWLHKNNITWQYAVTIITDIIKTQSNISSDITSNFDISCSKIDQIIKSQNDASNLSASGENEKINDVENDTSENYINCKPTDIHEKRKLLAAAAEKRTLKRF